MRCLSDLQGRRFWEPLLDRRTRLGVGPIDEQRTDPERTEVVDREGQHRLEHGRVAFGGISSESIEPAGHRRLVMPADTLPAQNARRSDDPDRPRGVPLNDCCLEHAGHHDKVPFRPRWAVEHDPLVVVVRAAQEPARESVGKSACRRERLFAKVAAGNDEFGSRGPRRWVRTWLDDGSATGNPTFVDRRTEGLIDLFEKYAPDDVGKVQPQPALFDLLGKPPKSRRSGLSHRTEASVWRQIHEAELQNRPVRSRPRYRSLDLACTWPACDDGPLYARNSRSLRFLQRPRRGKVLSLQERERCPPPSSSRGES